METIIARTSSQWDRRAEVEAYWKACEAIREGKVGGRRRRLSSPHMGAVAGPAGTRPAGAGGTSSASTIRGKAEAGAECR